MKAIHVGTTKNSRIYYLLESDDQSTGAVVTANQPVVYVDFFAYVSKKGSIERVMDSEFHEFLWTGHTGSLSERWEQTFVHRVTSPREMALSGVDVLTEFKEKKKADRASRLNERANRAVEYKALVGAGLNEKAFARRGVRRIGRSMGDAASGGVRGFRRGVRFDPEAEDADGDGFVQEGTQHARRAMGGMRSSWGQNATPGTTATPEAKRPSFLPPEVPPVPTAQTTITRAQDYVDLMNDPFLQAMVSGSGLMTVARWHEIGLAQQQDGIREIRALLDGIRERVGVHIDGNDPQEILDAHDAREAALRALIGGREIRTIKDAKELAFIVHPLFEHGGGSEWTLLNGDDGDLLNDYQRTLLVSALTLLAANPRFKKQTVLLDQSDLPSGAGGTEQWQTGSRWSFDSAAADTLAKKVKKVLARMGGTWSESGMTPEPFTPQERHALLINPGLIDQLEPSSTGLTGMEGEDTRQVTNRSLIARLGEIFTPWRSDRIGRTHVTYAKEDDPGGRVELVEDIIRGTRMDANGQPEPFIFNSNNDFFTESRYATADALFATLMAYADTFPPEERNRILRKAAALHASAVMIHELGGHSTHSANQIGWALEKIGPDPVGGGDDPRYKKLLTSAITTISERIKKHPLVEKFVLDSRTISEYAKSIEDKGLGAILQGQFGLEFEDIHAVGGGSVMAPGGVYADSFAMRGIHGVLRKGTDTQKQRLKAVLSQPVMDTHGNPYTANAGLSQYFEELKEVALKEWGIDLTIGAGEQLTLAHILFGTNPHEDGLPALIGDFDKSGKSTFKIHKKGGFAFLRGAANRAHINLPTPVVGSVQYRARKARKHNGSYLHPHIEAHAGGTEPSTSGPITPDLISMREHGIPAFSTKKVVRVQSERYLRNPGDPTDARTDPGESIGIETTVVKPEDAAPLLDALAHLVHVFPNLDDSELDSQNGTVDEVLDQLENITFDSVPDVEIGLTGKKLSDFLEDMSPEQQQAFRDELSTGLIIDLILQSMGTKGYVGRVAAGTTGTGTDPKDYLEGSEIGVLLDRLIEKIAMSAEWSDELSDKHVKTLTELADSLGYMDYAAYGGAVTGFDVLDSLLGNTRHEMIAELMTAMILGLDLPIYTGGKRRPLKPEQISALKALFELWQPGGTPKIRSRGRLAPIYGK